MPALVSSDLAVGTLDRFYCSGLTSVSDLMLAAPHEVPFGIDIQRLSAPARIQLARAIVIWHADVFIDSGAYGSFRAAERSPQRLFPHEVPGRLDFDRVFAAYEELLATIDDNNPVEEDYVLSVVLPDVVGAQRESLDALRAHRRQLDWWLDLSRHRCIVPLQAGERTLAEMYDAARDALGSARFAVGIPSHAAAAPLDQVLALVRSRPVVDIHFLGAGSAATLASRTVALRAIRDDLWLTADANRLRGKLKPGTTRAEALAAALAVPIDTPPDRDRPRLEHVNFYYADPGYWPDSLPTQHTIALAKGTRCPFRPAACHQQPQPASGPQ